MNSSQLHFVRTQCQRADVRPRARVHSLPVMPADCTSTSSRLHRATCRHSVAILRESDAKQRSASASARATTWCVWCVGGDASTPRLRSLWVTRWWRRQCSTACVLLAVITARCLPVFPPCVPTVWACAHPCGVRAVVLEFPVAITYRSSHRCLARRLGAHVARHTNGVNTGLLEGRCCLRHLALVTTQRHTQTRNSIVPAGNKDTPVEVAVTSFRSMTATA